MKRIKWLGCVSLIVVLLCNGCGAEKNGAETEKEEVSMETVETEKAYRGIQELSLYIEGYDLGPGVSKIIMNLGEETVSVEANEVQITTAGIERSVADIYLCDGNGNRMESASKYIAFELTEEHMMEGALLTQGEISSVWVDNYPVTVTISDLKLGEERYSFSAEEDCIARRVCPDSERFSYRSSYTGISANPLTGEQEELTLQMAAYEPEEMLEGDEKKPLMIWLHGAGEGGTDPDITILGNKVSALTKENIQSKFSSGNEMGAYVLVVQCSTYWMDEGDGTNGAGSGDSKYTGILMDAILAYLQHNENVDTDRIYLTGCSNGGYMTMNMAVHYPDFFAAAVPVCEAYSYYILERDEKNQYIFCSGTPYQKEDGVWSIEYEIPEGRETGAMGSLLTDDIWLTEEKVQALKELPVWFVASADDPIVPVNAYALPTYKAVKESGNENCWISLFESYGHSAWIPFLDSQVTGVQEEEGILSASELKDYEIMPSDEGGGARKAGEYENIFAWMNGQKKEAER